MTKKKQHREKRETREGARAGTLPAIMAAVATRGRTFEGFVTKKFPARVVVEFERTVYVPKYQRFTKNTTRLHARLPQSMQIDVGDYVRVRECRPLSKIIHFIVIERVRAASEMAGTKPAAAKETVKEAAGEAKEEKT